MAFFNATPSGYDFSRVANAFFAQALHLPTSPDVRDRLSLVAAHVTILVGLIAVSGCVAFFLNALAKRWPRRVLPFWGGRGRPGKLFYVVVIVYVCLGLLVGEAPATYASTLAFAVAPGFIVATLSFAAAYSVLCFARLFSDRYAKRIQANAPRGELVGLTVEGQARAYLQMIRFQQSYTTGWGGKLNVSAKVAGAEYSHTSSVSRAQQPWTMPEIVAHFRSFFTRVGKRGKVLIAIDEMDKITSTAQAAFSTNLKRYSMYAMCSS